VNALPTAAVALGDEIERFGSYFGYAAIIGLGVLSLLYFAQAREVRRLREWAGRAPERDAEVAQRVQSDAQRRVVAQPVPTPGPQTPAAQSVPSPGPQTPAAQSAEAARKAAAATVIEKFQPSASAPAAPAVGPPGSLTRATPAAGAPTPAATPDADAPPAAPGAPAPAPSPAAAAAASVAAANADKPQASAPDAPAPPAHAPPPLPPGMSAATADAVAAARQAATPSRSPAFSNGTGGQETHESDAARPAPLPDLPPIASTGSRRPRAPLPAAHDAAGLSRGRKGAIVAAAAVVLVLGIVLVLVLTSGGTNTPPAGNQIGDATPPAAVPPPAAASGLTKAERAATSVAVLNGTTQTGLASAVAQTIEKKGFTILATKTNADQQIATTTVSYSLGNERAARAVAQIMRVPASAIGPIDANTSVAASPEAKIVVLVGTDKSGAG
jgi:hypothetical protein